MRKTFTRTATVRSIAHEDEREKVEIYFSCRGLKDLDTFSKSDPQVYFSRQIGTGWIRIGETEVVYDNLNPDFSTSFQVDFIFEKRQKFKVEVRDIDNKQKTDWESLGEAEFEMGRLIGAKSNRLMMVLKNPKNQKIMGKIVIRAEKVALNNDIFELYFFCKDIPGFGMCSSPKPFIKIQKPRITAEVKKLIEKDELSISNLNNFEWLQVYTSEVHSKPEFGLKKLRIQASKLCSGLFDIPLKVQLLFHQSNGSHTYKAEAVLNVSSFLSRGVTTWKFINPGTKAEFGTLELGTHKKIQNFQFVEYLRGGMEISLITCIDFTGSNGIPTAPTSLHYMNRQGMNDYQKAINSVGSILLNYDTDKLVQTYGFGAKPVVNGYLGATSHFFPLSGDFQNCSGKGIKGVFDLYSNALQNIELSGPTYFNHLLKEIRTFTENNFKRDDNTYTVLLILTDGVIHDMSASIDEIIKASNLPLSIIIVGIGNEDFTLMDQLDSDNELLRGSSGTAQRDIVQFVPFRKFKSHMNQGEHLAAAVLEELPHQVTSFYRSINKKPNVVNTGKKMNQFFGGMGKLMNNTNQQGQHGNTPNHHGKKPGALPPINFGAGGNPTTHFGDNNTNASNNVNYPL